MVNASLIAHLDTHQEDQAMQEQCIEEANSACHLVGENQSPLRSKQGVEWGWDRLHPFLQGCLGLLQRRPQGSTGRGERAAGSHSTV